MSDEKAAYILVDVKITNNENYEKYKSLAKPLIEKFGGEYLTRGGHMEVVLDELWSPTRMVLVKFPNLGKIKEWLNSPEYEEVAKIRLENSVGTFGELSGNLTKEEKLIQLRDKTARRNASEGNRVGDIVDISEERAFEAELDAEVERSRAGDRSGLDDALQLY